MIESKIYKGAQPGKKLLVFGAIHGNETCGPEAIRQVMGRLDHGDIVIEAGQVTFIPVCNPAAYKADKRYIEINLNRVMKTQDNPQAYEEKLAVELTAYIDACDALLDLHSMHTPAPPFVFQDVERQDWRDFAEALNIPDIVVGWPGIYEEQDYSTAGYAAGMGKTAVTVECGMHHDPQGNAIGVMCIERALQFYGLTDLGLPPVDKAKITRVRMTNKFIRQGGGEFTKNWNHMDRVQKGEIIARGDNPVTAPYDGFMILPFHQAQDGDEWFYLGRPA